VGKTEEASWNKFKKITNFDEEPPAPESQDCLVEAICSWTKMYCTYMNYRYNM
jgi:hypothetical protein